MTGPFAALGQQVTCGTCTRTYTVTPADGYYTGADGSGVCFTCLLERVIILTGPEVFDARGQRVTCRDCKRTWICTPEADYYGEAGGGLPVSATSGRCFACMLTAGGMDPEITPVMVIDATGAAPDGAP